MENQAQEKKLKVKENVWHYGIIQQLCHNNQNLLAKSSHSL